MLMCSSSIYHLLSAVEPDSIFREKFFLLPCRYQGNPEREDGAGPLYTWDMTVKEQGKLSSLHLSITCHI